MVLDQRKENLLKAIVQEYVRTAEPVGSSFLVSKYRLGVSPATIRNDMAELEEEGFIAAPHTSAGRIPTEAGYRYYIQNFLSPKPSKSRQLEEFRKKAVMEGDKEELLKSVAKFLAVNTGEAVIVGLSPRHYYSTGFSGLFAKPEFAEAAFMRDFSEIMDRLDEVMEVLWGTVPDNIQILVGHESPFGNRCGTIVTRFNTGDMSGILGVLGSLRMNYDRNYSLISYARKMLADMNL